MQVSDSRKSLPLFHPLLQQITEVRVLEWSQGPSCKGGPSVSRHSKQIRGKVPLVLPSRNELSPSQGISWTRMRSHGVVPGDPVQDQGLKSPSHQSKPPIQGNPETLLGYAESKANPSHSTSLEALPRQTLEPLQHAGPFGFSTHDRFPWRARTFCCMDVWRKPQVRRNPGVTGTCPPSPPRGETQQRPEPFRTPR